MDSWGRWEACPVHSETWPWKLESSSQASWSVSVISFLYILLHIKYLPVSLSLFSVFPHFLLSTTFAGLNRCGKSCRLRWTNYLRPDIKRGKFSEEEEQTILHLHSILGNKYFPLLLLPFKTASFFPFWDGQFCLSWSRFNVMTYILLYLALLLDGQQLHPIFQAGLIMR